jgi:hypothetical protein
LPLHQLRVNVDADPLVSVLVREHRSGDKREACVPPAPSGRIDKACALATSRLLGLRAVAQPLHTVTVPHGSAGLATVVADGSGHLLPSTGAGLDLALESDDPADPAGRGAVADALAAVSVGHDGHHDLLLDLLAVSSLQAWARWLPGFAGSSVPFLLTTFVRRPAAVEVGDDELTVLLPARSHDVVLELAGYLEPVDAGPTLGGRRVRFVTEDGHGT